MTSWKKLHSKGSHKRNSSSTDRFGGKEFDVGDVSEQEWENIEAYAEKHGIRHNRLLKVRVTSNQRPMLVYEGDDGLESDAIPDNLVPARFRIPHSSRSKSPQKLYTYVTDSEHGTVQASNIDAALDKVKPTRNQLDDGAFAMVKDPETAERRKIGHTF